jgi:hypothetical protein
VSVSTSNYSQPVQVNGYTCKNCTDVDYAKKHIDPQHPKSGPYGVNAATDPTQKPAVAFGGALSALNGLQGATQAGGATSNTIDVRA